eukprot:5455899-Amphidinium_carterae.1
MTAMTILTLNGELRSHDLCRSCTDTLAPLVCGSSMPSIFPPYPCPCNCGKKQAPVGPYELSNWRSTKSG